ncbi:MAG: amidohydrolase [Rhodothermales bacterium]|nr:amidohydrolase [Rhodothermales bacterium]
MKSLPFRFLLVLAGFVWLIGCGAPAEPAADLVLTNGRIVSVDSLVPEARALAVRGDRIVALGTEEEIASYIGDSTQVIDLAGRLAIPGLIEGHGHFLGIGEAKMILDLTKARTWQEMVDMVAEAVQQAEPGAWILGRGWHQEKWDETPAGSADGVPTHHTMSAASPENPVYLTHASGHASFANALALELGRVSPETPDPAGGEIVHDAQGEPTGLLRETAQGLVGRALESYLAQRSPEQIEADLRKQVELAGAAALMAGITSFHDAGSSFEEIDFLKRMADEGALPVRLYVMLRGESPEELDARMDAYFLPDYGNHFLNVRSIKLAIDGALGPHGAWLLEPYEDMPSSAGLNLESIEALEAAALVAIAHNYQVNIHAIGDRANREVLDIYERLFAAHPDKTDLRWRIEHAQHLHPDDIPRMADLGVIAAMQGVHATSDGPWVPKRLGEQRSREGAYVWQSLWDAGVVVGNGTDAPVEDVSALASYYATVSRRLNDGSVFYPEQRLTREQALASYTINNAYAAFEETIKGTLTPGKLADITVLSRDILSIPEEEIPATEVVMTIIGGRVAYRTP